MRILIVGNMANDGYSVAKGLWKMNKDVDLAVNSSDFGMALPEWEDGNITSDTVDPYKVNRNEIKDTLSSGRRVRYFDFLNKAPRKKSIIPKIKSRINLYKMMREYDVLEAHVPYTLYAQFVGIPFVAYDAGWIRYFPYEDTFRARLARRSYKKAKKLIITNPDTFEIVDNLAYLDSEKNHFCPFAIDPEKYKPLKADELRSKYVAAHDSEEEILLFSPSRQTWKEKGNDKILRAYARFCKVFRKSRFIMVDWAVDAENSKMLAKTLGILDRIIWIKPVPKNQLIEYYNASDIILDQFVLGSWGTSTPEAMSCSKPVLMSYKKHHIMRAFGEEPPVLNSFTEDDIYTNLLKLARDVDYRKSVGKSSREWVIKTHSPDIVASKHLDVLTAVGSR
jgi:glycosyltransferase involved in cell wall biosynthesis